METTDKKTVVLNEQEAKLSLG